MRNETVSTAEDQRVLSALVDAQYEVATKLARVLESQYQRRESHYLDRGVWLLRIANANEHTRRITAAWAGVHPPSAATWASVTEVLRRWDAEAAAGAVGGGAR